jgi:hypothetical protein
VFREARLRYAMKAYASHYNEVRTYLSSHGNGPDFQQTLKIDRVAAIPILGALHLKYAQV